VDACWIFVDFYGTFVVFCMILVDVCWIWDDF